jgi:glycosyltransferase involved in cell wall biosynthesis
MRICMITHSLYESDGRVMRYAETLAARGDTVDVIALKKEGKPKEEIIASVRVLRVQSRSFQEKTRLSFLKQIALFFLKACWTASRRHMKHAYDLVHVHSIPDTIVFVAWLPKLLGAKIILDIHDILPELYASKFGAGDCSLGFRAMLLAEKRSAAFADHVIIANHIWKQRLVARSVKPDRCTVLLNYPDRSVFRPVERTGARNKFVMLYPGTLNYHQGLDVAIRAFAKIKDRVPTVDFHIHGEGRTQGALMKLVDQLQMQGRVLFKPMLPIRQIAKVMAQADLAVVPKRRDAFGDEAFSTKILEFMSLGIPVLVSDTKIDRYYFTDSCVQFFRDGDEDDLADKMKALITDPHRRSELARNASALVQSFDWESKKAIYLKLVDSLASRPALARAADARTYIGTD